MLDPLSALSVVSNVVQLISFTAEIVTESYAYVKSQRGVLPSCRGISQLVELQHAAYGNISAVEDTAKPLKREEQALRKIAQSCVDESRQLICILEALEIRPSANGKRKFGSAFKSVVKARWNRSDIEQRRQKLASYQEQLLLELIGLIRREQTLQFGALRELTEHQGDLDSGRILVAKSELLAAIEAERLQRETSTQSMTDKLTDLAISLDTNQDLLLAGGTRNHDELMTEARGHRIRIEQIGDDVGMDFEELRSDLESINRLLLSKEGQDRAEIILDSLRFSDMELRRATISDAHNKTFEWIFNDTSSIFKEWLASSGRMFWVNGKAGSGKSTLMKFLASNTQTERMLQLWAKDAPLVVVDFYFWYLGSSLQKSEEGLLRSILYQILRACPVLICYVAKRRWDNKTDANEPWSVNELRQTLESVAAVPNKTLSLPSLDHRQRSQAQTDVRLPRFCFFIDGLDEYSADQPALVELLQGMSRKDRFKICVSSRPWNVFTRAFGKQREQLVLQDLTRTDIETYVMDSLESSYPNNAGLDELATEVTSKAQGVFLWVYLTIRSIREGIAEGDDLITLRERVAELPSDLSEYFQVILSRVHPVYKKSKTMSALYMAVAATRAVASKAGASSLSRHFSNFWLLRKGIKDPNFALRQSMTRLTDSEYDESIQRTRAFLSAICKDLLYLPHEQSGTGRKGAQVEFLHRTVYEFLDSDEMMPQIVAGAMPLVLEQHFPVSLTLWRLKMNFYDSRLRLLEALNLITDAVENYLDLDTEHGRLLLADLEMVISTPLEEFDHRYSPSVLDHLQRLLSHNCYSITATVLKSHPWIYSGFGWDCRLLESMLLGYRASIPDQNTPAFVDYLLSFDINLNKPHELISDPSPDWDTSPESIWERFIVKCIYRESLLNYHYLWKTTQVLIKHGADLHMTLRNGWTVYDVLDQHVAIEPQDNIELNQLYETERLRATKEDS